MDRRIRVSDLIVLLCFALITIMSFFRFYFHYEWMIWLQISLCMVIFVLELQKNHMLFSAGIIWLLFWLLFSVIAQVPSLQVRYGLGWSEKLFLLIIMNNICFFLMYWWNSTVATEKQIKRMKLSEKEVSLSFLDTEKIYIITVMILFGGIAFWMLNVLQRGYIPQLTASPNKYRVDFVSGGFYSIVNCCRIGMALAPIALKATKSGVKKAVVLILAGVFIICELLTAWRGYFFQDIILFCTVLFFLMREAQISKLIKRGVVVAMIAVFAFYYIAVTRKFGARALFTSASVEYAAQQVLDYFVPSFLNMGQAVDSLTPNYNIVYTTEALWGSFVDGSYFPSYEPLSFISLGVFNVSTYLLHPYADFGFYGVAFWAILFGILAGKSEKSMQINPSISNLLFSAIMNIIVFTMHNSFILRSSSIIIWIIVAVIVVKWCRKKAPRTVI